MNNQLLSIINEMLEESEQTQLQELNDSLNLRDDLNMDSLMLAELTVRIENEFDVDIFEDGFVQTIGDVISKIESK